MKHVATALLTFLTFLLLALVPPSSSAQEVIHYWNFNDPGADESWPQPVSATAGSGTITYSFGSNVTDFIGTTINSQDGDPRGQSFVVQGGSGEVNNGEHFDLNVSTEGFESLEIAYATQRTSTGFDAQAVSVSTDGGSSFTDLTAITDIPGSFGLRTVSLAGVSGADDNPDLVVRVTLDGATSTFGNNRFDNITVEGVPLGDDPDDPAEPEITPIADARDLEDGAEVTVEAIVTRVEGSGLYFQDATAGLQAFDGGGWTGLADGDEVRLTGTMDTFFSARQLSVDEAEVVSSDNVIPAPIALTIASYVADIEAVQGELVQFENVLIDDKGDAVFQAGGTDGSYTITDGSGAEATLRFNSADDSELVGEPIPSGPVTLTGPTTRRLDDPRVLAIRPGDIAAGDDPDDPDALDLITYWNFNDSYDGDPAVEAVWPQPVPASVGTGRITYTLTDDRVVDFSGSGTNARGGDPAGGSFSVQGGSGTINNGRHFDVVTSTIGHENVVLTYATRGTGSGFDTQAISFSVDGGTTFSDITTISVPGSFAEQTIDLSAFPSASDATELIVRFTLDGATGTSGNNRFDNLTLEGNRIDVTTQSIADAREASEGTSVTVEGVVTRARGRSVRLQDGTGAITLFEGSGDLGSRVASGDRVQVQGTRDAFAQQVQLTDVSETVVSSGNAVPLAGFVTLERFEAEFAQLEAQLVTTLDLSIDDQGDASFSANTSYGITDASITDPSVASTLRIGSDDDSFWPGVSIPEEEVAFTGVAGRFGDTAQLLPIAQDDLDFLQLISIQDAREAGEGATVFVEGVVSRAFGEFARLQDTSGPEGASGLTLRQRSGPLSDAFQDAIEEGTIAPGTRLQVVGTISAFNGLLQLNNQDLTSFEIIGQEEAPTPLERTLQEISDTGTTLESVLVRVADLEFVDPNGNLENNTTYDVTDGSLGAFDLRVQQPTETNVAGLGIPSDPVDYAGVVGSFQGTPQLIPVRRGDFALEDLDDLLACEIQGTEILSPFSGRETTTRGNLVTAIATNGFYMQMPERLPACDDTASLGLFVFAGDDTDVLTEIAVGDDVSVTGTVDEFFGWTQLAGDLTVTVESSGNDLPAPVRFDALTPDPGGAETPVLFRYQSMIVEVENGITTSPSDNFGNFFVDAAGVFDAERNFRQPGVPQSLSDDFPDAPIFWNENQQLFEIDPGAENLPTSFDVGELARGSTITYARGPLAFRFDEHRLLPLELDVTPRALDEVTRPVRERADGEFTMATLNLLDLFGAGEGSTPGGFSTRLEKHAAYICDLMDAPSIIGLQELGGPNALSGLIGAVEETCGVTYEGTAAVSNDPRNIRTGAMWRSNVSDVETTALAVDETFTNPNTGNPTTTHDRPPLLLTGTVDTSGEAFPLEVIVVHNRSFIDALSSSPFARVKRQAQAISIANLVQERQLADPEVRLAVLGDFNDYEFSDGIIDVVGIIAGTADPAESLLDVPPPIVQPALTNQVLGVPATDRYSFIFEGTAQVLDHILTSEALTEFVTDIAYPRGNADAPLSFLSDASTPLRSSDHEGLVLFLSPTPDLVCAPPDFFLDLDVDASTIELTFTDPEGLTQVAFTDPEGNPALTNLAVTAPEGFVPDSEGLVWTFEGDGLPSSSVFTLTGVPPAGTPSGAPYDVSFFALATNGCGTTVDIDPPYTLTAPVSDDSFTVEGNYPNPFASQTTITYHVPELTDVRVTVYDLLGRHISTLVDAPHTPGHHEIRWNGHSSAGQPLSSGVYILRVQTDTETFTRRMTLVR